MYALTVHAKNQTKMDQTIQSEARSESSIRKPISMDQMRFLVRNSGKRTFAERHASDPEPAGGAGYTRSYADVR